LASSARDPATHALVRTAMTRAVLREAAILALWKVIRKPRSRLEYEVQLRLARWALSWLDWARLQADEWVVQLEDLEYAKEKA
jgi:hypothetical protein